MVYVHRKDGALESASTPGTIRAVPNQPRTQHRSVRIDDETWAAAEKAATGMGTDRAKVINQFLHWYLRHPGAELPDRPADADAGAAKN